MSEETSLSRGSVYSIRPVVEVDGQAHEMVQTLLVSMDLKESEQGLAALELVFNNTATLASAGNDFAFEYEDNDTLSPGRTLSVKTGDRNTPEEIFSGVISGIEMVVGRDSQPKLIVLAEDGLQRARMNRRTRLFQNRTVAGIVRTVASDLGLRAEVSGLDRDAGDQLQLNQSDLAFLRNLVRRYDGDLHMTGGMLHAAPRPDIRNNELTLELGSQLLSIRTLADLSHQVTGVSFSGWDIPAGREIEVESGPHVDLGPGRGRTGAEMLERGFGPRVEHLSRQAAAGQAEAQALVDGVYGRRARAFVCAEGLAQGNPGIRVGAHVTIRGTGPRFDNTYYIVSAHHSYDLSRGYQTRFKAECAHLGG